MKQRFIELVAALVAALDDAPALMLLVFWALALVAGGACDVQISCNAQSFNPDATVSTPSTATTTRARGDVR